MKKHGFLKRELVELLGEVFFCILDIRLIDSFRAGGGFLST